MVDKKQIQELILDTMTGWAAGFKTKPKTEEERDAIMVYRPTIRARPHASVVLQCPSCDLAMIRSGDAISCPNADCDLRFKWYKVPVLELVLVDAPEPEADTVKITRDEHGNHICDQFPFPACHRRKARKLPIVVDVKEMLAAFSIETLEGIMKGKAGDFLITGIKGEMYPCDRDVFFASYELVDRDAIKGESDDR